MRFLSPERLLLLVALTGLLATYVVLQRRRKQYAVRFTNLSLLDKVAPRQPGWRRHVPAAAFLAMLALLVIGFARPEAPVKVPRERATVIIAVDVSASMQATDVEPNRFEAAQRAARQFVDGLPKQFNVGLVSFSGSANVLVPPTTDRAAVHTGIDRLALGPRTAIGEAIFTPLDAIAAFDDTAETNPPPARVVLLSDGENTAGREPSEAAQAAADAHVPVSTIAYGTDRGMLELQGQVIPVPVDGPTLKSIAEVTGGQFYEAATGQELEDVYSDIGSSVGYRTEWREVSAWFIGLGLLAALGTAAASLVWFSRLP
jgi:Ca-activated chloride channel family protein